MLNNHEKKYFRQIGHTLQPVVTLGDKGLTDTVLAEIERALEDHELIKVRINADSREQKAAFIETICSTTGAEIVQTIGHVVLLYRAAQQPDPKLSNLLKK